MNIQNEHGQTALILVAAAGYFDDSLTEMLMAYKDPRLFLMPLPMAITLLPKSSSEKELRLTIIRRRDPHL